MRELHDLEDLLDGQTAGLQRGRRRGRRRGTSARGGPSAPPPAAARRHSGSGRPMDWVRKYATAGQPPWQTEKRSQPRQLSTSSFAEALQHRRRGEHRRQRLLGDVAAVERGIAQEGAGVDAAVGSHCAGHLARATHVQPQRPPTLRRESEERVAGEDPRVVAQKG